MKKIIKVLCVLLLILVTGNYVSRGGEVRIDEARQKIRASSYYTSKEIETGMKLVIEDFKGFQGCTLKYIWNDEDYYTPKERELFCKEYNVQQVMMIKTDFKTDFFKVTSGLNRNADYTDFQWILVKDKNNKWSIKTHGYG